MITSKFGGSSVTPQNFHCLNRLVKNDCCVVVSAVGKEFCNDVKTTDLLARYYFGDEHAWECVCNKFLRLVEVNGVRCDVERLLFDAKKQSKNSLYYCLSLGEEITAKIASCYLNCAYLESADLVRFDGSKFCKKATLNNLKSAFCGLKRGVIGGFYGGFDNDRRVFSRGGGDVTGALCAVATDSYLYENWTDVNGVCKANPKFINGAQTVSQLSYREMYALAKGGAEVLHPDAVKIAGEFGVPIVVGNSLNEFAPTTLISYCPSRLPFLSVTEKTTAKGIQSTVLHNLSQQNLAKCLQQVFHKTQRRRPTCDCAEECPIVTGYSVNSDSVKILSSKSILKELYEVFGKL